MARNRTKRTKPNILITGTPGTGKTTTSSALAEATELRQINIGDLVKEKNLHDGWDEKFECYVLNEDLVCDELEDIMVEGGNIVDYHGCDFFPVRWFDRVVVLQTENSILYDRLSQRDYSEKKISNNIQCEIFQVLLEEATNSYSQDIVVALKSDSVEDISRNVASLTEWVIKRDRFRTSDRAIDGRISYIYSALSFIQIYTDYQAELDLMVNSIIGPNGQQLYLTEIPGSVCLN